MWRSEKARFVACFAKNALGKGCSGAFPFGSRDVDDLESRKLLLRNTKPLQEQIDRKE